MRIQAVVATGKGGPEVLRLMPVELAWPRGPRDVLVRLHWASLNPADVFFRQLGAYLDGGGPLVLGHDGAGIVEAVGGEVQGFAPGDRVCFCHGGIGGEPGTYAEAAVVPATLLARVPDGVELRAAAALPLVAITAFEALAERAAIAAGETVLIHAGGGGTGHVAIQVARLAGARVATTVSSPAKTDLVARLGAELAIDYRRHDFVAAARDWTQGRGVAVALDNVGGETAQRTLRAMAPYGRLVTLMGTPADDAETTAYNANLTIHNVMMLTPMWRGLTERLAAQAELVRRALSLVAEGRLVVQVADELPLGEAAAAHARLEAGGQSGKLVLRIAG